MAPVADRLRRSACAVAILVVVLAGTAACSGGTDEAKTPTTFVALDGSPRRADAEGVVEKVADDFATITLDGDRTYRVSEAVQSFSTIDGSTLPLRGRLGQYVQVGLDGETVVWVASVAAVLRAADEPPVVLYTGDLIGRDGDELTFRDGTVLSLGDGVEVPEEAMRVIVTIDPEHHVVIAVDAS